MRLKSTTRRVSKVFFLILDFWCFFVRQKAGFMTITLREVGIYLKIQFCCRNRLMGSSYLSKVTFKKSPTEKFLIQIVESSIKYIRVL